MKVVILNKPFNVLSQFREDETHLTVTHFINDPSLRIAGRLDLDSEGLMFLTDHGGLNQFITNPANKKFKTYLSFCLLAEAINSSFLSYKTISSFNDNLTLSNNFEAINFFSSSNNISL